MRAFRIVLVLGCLGVMTALASAQNTSAPPKKGAEQKSPPKAKAPKGKPPGADGLATKLPDLVVSDLDITGPLKCVDNAWRIPAKARLTPKLPLKADSVPDKELLKKTIPALGDGKSVTFTVDTFGRGVFTAITADAFGNTGRIVSASVGGGLVKVEIETPK